MPISLLTDDDFTPKPPAEAVAAFARKVAVPTRVFDELSTEAKQLAFRIAGVHKARLLQRARDVVKRAIRDGTPFAEVRRKLSAIFADEGVESPALSRLRLVFQQNSQQAYNDARRTVLDDPEVTAAFPYRMYLTVGNGTAGVRGVRPEHAALHRLVFKWDDPFWDAHTPPWEFGCRCTTVALTAGQVKRMGVRVRNLGYVRKRIKVKGQKRRGIAENPGFIRGKLNLDAIDAEIRELLNV